jgi:DNA end-binding protein Ku
MRPNHIRQEHGREARIRAVHVHFRLHMRTTWNGSVSFGLVNIPVGLAPATKAAARQSDVSFRMLHRECATPIKQKRWCPVHERDVESDELVRGWEVAKGQFVIVEDADLEAIEQHDTSRSIEISRFVQLEEVDPVYFDRTYFLVPAGAEAQRRPYVLLLEAMKEAGVAALGRFVLAGKEKLCLIRAMGDALALETLFVHEDVKDHAEIDEAVSSSEVREPELELAKQIIASLAAPFDPGELRSEYRESLRELLEAKLAGQEIEAPEAPAPAPVVDLMEALRASVAAASAKQPSGTKKKAAPRKRAAASR